MYHLKFHELYIIFTQWSLYSICWQNTNLRTFNIKIFLNRKVLQKLNILKSILYMYIHSSSSKEQIEI